MAKTTTAKTTSSAKRPATAATRKTMNASVNPIKKTTAAAAVKPSVATPAQPAKAQPKKDDDVMRKPDLIEKVVARSGVKKKDAKPVIEAMLAEFGDALAEGREMRLPPLGKVIINRTKDLENGTAYIVKIRQPKKANRPDMPPSKDPLAKAAE